MFCQCKNEQNFDTLLPNTNICPVCTGQPWALPTLSEEVLMKALLLWKALNCQINQISQFDRKSYFYPDLPMGYQITQLYNPTNVEGQIKFFLDNYNQEKSVHIIDAHMECDTGKMIHNGWQALLDFNRSGTPLVEIVTWPDFNYVDEVVEFLKELQRIARYNHLADADMEKWQMRVDVNISVRNSHSDPLWTRVEVKNVNSFWAIKRAIEHEYIRQTQLYEKGKKFDQQTRWWDDIKWESYLMRSKEDALDYRYFPEPDLPPLVLSDEINKRLNNQKVEIPYDIIKIFKSEYGFNKEYINALISDKEVLDYFFQIMSSLIKWSHTESRKAGEGETIPLSGINSVVEDFSKLIAKRIAGPISAWIKENLSSINDLKFSREKFNSFLQIAQEWKLLESQLKIVMDEMLKTWEDPEKIIKSKWFDAPKLDQSQLEKIAKEVLEENPNIVEQYKWWKTTTMGFFVWLVMKKSWGKANPKAVQDILTKLLS